MSTLKIPDSEEKRVYLLSPSGCFASLRMQTYETEQFTNFGWKVITEEEYKAKKINLHLGRLR